MWTEITRPKYERRGGRYASDLTDREWALIAPFMPPRKKIGRPRTTELRNVMDAIMYMASTGCQWAMLPNDFPPPSTVQRYFYDWRSNGLLEAINHHLVVAARELEGREAGPSAGVIDSQSVKTVLVIEPPRPSIDSIAAATISPWRRRSILLISMYR